jgi:hypothetical protein
MEHVKVEWVIGVLHVPVSKFDFISLLFNKKRMRLIREDFMYKLAIFLIVIMCSNVFSMDTKYNLSHADCVSMIIKSEDDDKRNIGTVDSLTKLQDIYLKCHRFDKARSLYNKYPKMNLFPVPVVVNVQKTSNNIHRYYIYQAERKKLVLKTGIFEQPAFSMMTLERKSKTMKFLSKFSGTYILIYGDPSNEATIKSIKDIESDNMLNIIFGAWGSLIGDSYNLNKVSQWNREHFIKYKIAYSVNDWKELKRKNLPEFLFFKDGKQVCSVGGWKGKESLKEVKKCLETNGYLSDEFKISTLLRMNLVMPFYLREEYAELLKKGYRKLLSEGYFKDEFILKSGKNMTNNLYSIVSHSMYLGNRRDKILIMKKLFLEMERKGVPEQALVEGFYGYLLNERDFETARLIAQKYKEYGLRYVPIVENKVKDGKPFVYRVGANKLYAQEIKLKNMQIVIAAYPGCHFADNAFKEIEKDAKLLKIFKKHALILYERSEFDDVRKWNNSHELKYKLVSSPDDWPAIDFSGSPIFHFLKDGQVVYTVIGWPKEGNMDEIYKGLGRLGLGEVK